MSDRAQVTKYSASVLAGCYRCSPCSHQLQYFQFVIGFVVQKLVTAITGTGLETDQPLTRHTDRHQDCQRQLLKHYFSRWIPSPRPRSQPLDDSIQGQTASTRVVCRGGSTSLSYSYFIFQQLSNDLTPSGPKNICIMVEYKVYRMSICIFC